MSTVRRHNTPSVALATNTSHLPLVRVAEEMIPKSILVVAALSVSSLALAQRAIECEASTKLSRVRPGIYLNRSELLCFDVLDWSEYQGQNCVKNGQSIQWNARVPVIERDHIHAREFTQFRVRSALVTDERLNYTVEWSRGAEWHLLQQININRVTGSGAISRSEGSEPMQCRTVSKKI